MVRAAEGGTRSGARGNTRGRCARPRGAGSSQPSPNNGSPAPSVLVRKAATIKAKLRHRGLPHTNICSLWVSFWIYATNLRLKARFLLAGARMAFRKNDSLETRHSRFGIEGRRGAFRRRRISREARGAPREAHPAGTEREARCDEKRDRSIRPLLRRALFRDSLRVCIERHLPLRGRLGHDVRHARPVRAVLRMALQRDQRRRVAFVFRRRRHGVRNLRAIYLLPVEPFKRARRLLRPFAGALLLQLTLPCEDSACRRDLPRVPARSLYRGRCQRVLRNAGARSGRRDRLLAHLVCHRVFEQYHVDRRRDHGAARLPGRVPPGARTRMRGPVRVVRVRHPFQLVYGLHGVLLHHLLLLLRVCAPAHR